MSASVCADELENRYMNRPLVNLLWLALWLLCAGAVLACKLGERSTITIGGKAVEIDNCLTNLVQVLNDGGIETFASCCGHGKTNGYILLKDRILIVTAITNLTEVDRQYRRLGLEETGRWNQEKRLRYRPEL